MPDEDGNQKTETAPATSLHAYADGRVKDADPGSGGITGQNGLADGSSFTDGGHPGHTEFGETPAANGAPAKESTTASGDPEFVDPESPARAAAGRTPRGAPPA
jgi:hypothetical protein